MVEKAFLSVDNYLEFFKEIDDIYVAKQDALDVAFCEINSVYGHLLQDEKIENEFLVPEIPKNKKEAKKKAESKRGSRKNTSAVNETFATSSKITRDKTDDDLESIRIKSRMVLQKIPPDSLSLSASKREISMNNSTSSIQSVGLQSKRLNETGTKKKNSGSIDDSSVMCLAHSTPLVLSPSDDGNDTVFKTPDEEPSFLEKEENPDSVKKRIEEFEKRAIKPLLPSKLPLRTPDKKKKIQEEVKCTDNPPTSKQRLLRSKRALQEKNTNIDSSQSQYATNKKAAGLKNTITSSKIKPPILANNCKTTNQRQNENKENVKISRLEKKINEKLVPLQKKYFDQCGKEMKTQTSNDSSSTLKSVNSTQETEYTGIKLDKMKDPEPIEEAQYEINHVSENESSEDEERPKKQIPDWARKDVRDYPLRVQAWLNKQNTIYPWFHNKNIKTPRMEELFSGGIKMRPRTSSAVWNTKTYFK